MRALCAVSQEELEAGSSSTAASAAAVGGSVGASGGAAAGRGGSGAGEEGCFWDVQALASVSVPSSANTYCSCKCMRSTARPLRAAEAMGSKAHARRSG